MEKNAYLLYLNQGVCCIIRPGFNQFSTYLHYQPWQVVREFAL